ncbi:MAG: hypothetical protein KIT69_07035, partial [Propionibacteriaceae bacterium]|nr:hypothetical protein [Propionibacteriaceae bacterium]
PWFPLKVEFFKNKYYFLKKVILLHFFGMLKKTITLQLPVELITKILSKWYYMISSFKTKNLTLMSIMLYNEYKNHIFEPSSLELVTYNNLKYIRDYFMNYITDGTINYSIVYTKLLLCYNIRILRLDIDNTMSTGIIISNIHKFTKLSELYLALHTFEEDIYVLNEISKLNNLKLLNLDIVNVNDNLFYSFKFNISTLYISRTSIRNLNILLTNINDNFKKLIELEVGKIVDNETIPEMLACVIFQYIISTIKKIKHPTLKNIIIGNIGFNKVITFKNRITIILKN